MGEEDAARRSVVLADDAALVAATRVALKRTGYEPPNVVQRSADALAAVAWEQPAAAVVDAVLSGERGLLGLIRTLLQEAPRCAVIVVAPFPALHDAVVAAGACALVHDHDLRTLSWHWRAVCTAPPPVHAALKCREP